MKKILLIAAFFLVFGTVSAFAQKADSPESLTSEGEKLVTLNSSSGQISQLERRIDSLERQVRDQNNALRSLERDLSDLRRRR